jgi:serine/threonine-protein kinase
MEIPKKERKKEKAAPLLRKSPSLHQFSAFLAKMASAPRKILVERKVAIPKLDKLLLGRILALVLVISFLGWAGKALVNNWSSFNSPPMPTSASIPDATTATQSSATPTFQTARTNTPSPTRTSIPLTQTATPPSSTLGIGSKITGKDGMTLLYVPTGEFTMGSNYFFDEQPVHKVNLDAFWIDQTEVTNEMYAKCVADGDCTQPSDLTYYNDSEYADHPVVFVSWNDALNYCSWVGGELPTEAQWEKAASWNEVTQEKYVYPWGNHFDCKNGNFDRETPFHGFFLTSGKYCDEFPKTAPVGSFAAGASPYDVLDMAGNVWEWVSSSYTLYPYDPADGREDLTASNERVLRGGSFYSSFDDFLRSADRMRSGPTSSLYKFGFRCALDATP